MRPIEDLPEPARTECFGCRQRARLSAVLITAFIALSGAANLAGQESGLEFEVASIKPTVFPNEAYAAGFRAGAATNPCGGGTLSVSGTLVKVATVGICAIIRIAYGVKDYEVLGMPATLGIAGGNKGAAVSIDAEIATEAKQPPGFYEIEARAPGPDTPTMEQAREMLRALLRERFHLSVHRENRELSYYALVTAKDGPKLTPAAATCKPQPHPPLERITVCGTTMASVARNLNSYTDRPVLDMTGVTTKFDYDIPIDTTGGSFGDAVTAAIQAQLKIRLESRKGPMEVVVIDHVERPSEN